MQIVEKRLEELQPYENNPRKNDKAVPLVANSIKEFGFKVPIIVDKNGVIVAGHTRYLAAMNLGMEKVPTIVADDLTPEQVKAFRIADNKTSESARWDDIMLGEELEELLNYDWTDFGFNEAEFLELTVDESDTALFVSDDYGKTEHVTDYNRTPPTAGGSTLVGITRTEADAYANRAEELVSKRVIIVYRTDEDSAFIKQKLGMKPEETLPVILDVEKLKGDKQ